MALQFEIYSGSGEAIYTQIENQLRRAIATGKLLEGQQLPSVRSLAEQLTVNPNTVSRAYAELVTAGLLEAQPGRGVFVAPRRQIYSLEERQRRLNEAIEQFANTAAFLDFTLPQLLKQIESRLSDYSPTKTSKPSKKT
ncbi:MAG: GntR family transcriptional regulator [Chthoniobacterales bacterium]